MTKLRIIAAVVDTKQLTLYKEDGTTFIIPQGDPILKPIVDYITPIIAAKKVAEFDTNDFVPEEPNVYKDFEEKSSGGIKFFRVLKSAVAHIFKRNAKGEPTKVDAVEPQTIGSLEPKAEEIVQTEKITTAVDEIIANAKPVSAPDYNHRETTTEHTIIAKVGDTIIPGVDKMKGQFAHAAKMGSTKGVEAFFARLEPVMKNREHSVEDLLRFMEKGDLPIADDGCIIAYKKLYARGDKYVDPHTGKVFQRVGSYVCVDEKLVDPNRYNECSNGLHIGRRSYMGSFSGDTIMLCKIPPENVIAVPHRDPNKVRVCGYHILFKLSTDEFNNINKDKAMTEHSEGRKILAKAIAGDHIGRIEEVRITGQSGNGLKITPLEAEAKKEPKLHKNAAEAEAINIEDMDITKAAPVDPKAVSKTVNEAKTDAAKTPRQLYDEGRMAEIIAIKKKRKVSFQKLGFTEAEIRSIEAPVYKEPETSAPVTEETVAVVSTEVQDEDLDPSSLINSIKNYRNRVSTASLKEAKETVEPVWNEKFRSVQIETADINQDDKPSVSHEVKLTQKEEVRNLISIAVNTALLTYDRQQAAMKLRAIKSKSKIGWLKLLGDRNLQVTIESLLDMPPIAKPKEEPMTEAEEKPAETKAGNTPRDMYNRREWTALWTMKKKAKKGWETYGFTAAEIERLKTNKPDFI